MAALRSLRNLLLLVLVCAFLLGVWSRHHPPAAKPQPPSGPAFRTTAVSEAHGGRPTARLVGIETSRQEGFDRVEFTFDRAPPSWRVGYAPVIRDAARAVLHLTLDVVAGEDGPDFRGPFVHGKRGERFVYLSWGQVGPDGEFEMFRRAKLHLSALTGADVTHVMRTGSGIEAVLDLTDERGGPLCAAVRPPRVQWRVLPPTTTQPRPAASQPGGG